MKAILIILLFASTFSYSQVVTDSVKYITPSGNIDFSYTRAWTQYVTGDSLSAKSTIHKTRTSIHPLDLPISTVTQTALNLKVNYTDTASMLLAYKNGLNGKQASGSYVATSDTATMLTAYKNGLNGK